MTQFIKIIAKSMKLILLSLLIISAGQSSEIDSTFTDLLKINTKSGLHYSKFTSFSLYYSFAFWDLKKWNQDDTGLALFLDAGINGSKSGLEFVHRGNTWAMAHGAGYNYTFEIAFMRVYYDLWSEKRFGKYLGFGVGGNVAFFNLRYNLYRHSKFIKQSKLYHVLQFGFLF